MFSRHHVERLLLRHFYAHDPPHRTQSATNRWLTIIPQLMVWGMFLGVLGATDYLAWRVEPVLGFLFLLPLYFFWPVFCELLRTLHWAALRCKRP